MVTVVVLTHNEQQKIKNCLEALLSLDFPKNLLEIIVIDNNSQDLTKNIVNDFKINNLVLDIRLIELVENNLGFARGLGIRLAKNDFVAFVDADCVAYPNWLKSLLAVFENSPTDSIAAVGGPALFQKQSCVFSEARSRIHKIWVLGLGAEQVGAFESIKQVEHLPTANVLYKKNIVLEVGNFSAEMDQVCEDLDLSLRLNSSGYKLIWAPQAAVTHYQKTGWLNWAKRIFRYGSGQVKARGFNLLSWPKRFIPAFALSWILFYGTFFFGPLFLYLIVFGYALVAAYYVDSGKKLFPMFGFLVLTHLAYSLGLSWGYMCHLIQQKVRLTNFFLRDSN